VGEDMLPGSIALTPPEDTAANSGPIPAAMLENVPPMLNWPGCKRKGWVIEPPK